MVAAAMCMPVMPVTSCAAVMTIAEHPKMLLIRFKVKFDRR